MNCSVLMAFGFMEYFVSLNESFYCGFVDIALKETQPA